MKKNAASIDRAIRIIMGIGLITIAFVGPKTPLGFIGLIPLMTGFMGWCPMYSIFGISTCPLHNK